MSEWLLSDEEIKELSDRWQTGDPGEDPPIFVAKAQAKKLLKWLDSNGYLSHPLHVSCVCNLCRLRREVGWEK